jgi:tripartite-type tricarboxylate transporter receptor subunit TctC
VKQLADSRSDGYTFGMVSNGTNGAAATVFSKLPYDPVAAFDFIGRYGTVPWVMAVKPDSPIRDLAGFLASARAQPGKLAGNQHSGSSRLVLNLLKVRGKVDLVEVAYVNPLHVVADVGSGQLQFGFLTPDMAANFEKQGRIRLIGATSAERISELPDVPAIAETLPGFEFVSWIGLAAPAGTPAPVMQKLRAAFFQALSQPDMKERMRTMGMTLVVDPKEDFAGLIREETAFWTKHAKELGITQAQ